jgi:PAS domain S-box-containing protein
MNLEKKSASVQRKLLIVDDEEPIRKLLKTALESYGYACDLAECATEAWDHLGEQSFDLVLCDVGLGAESGFDLSREIIARYPDTGVVIVSGLDDNETMSEAVRLGVFGYLLKPFEINQLLISVACALRILDLEKEGRILQGNLEERVRERTRDLQESFRRQEETQEKLRESEELFRKVVEGSNDGISIIQGETFVYVNPRYLKMFRFSSEAEVVGKPVADLTHPEERDTIMDGIERLQKGGEVDSRIRCKRILKDGAMIHAESTPAMIHFRGKPAVLSMVRDITKQAKAEEALLRKAEELSDNKTRLQKALSEISALIQQVATEKDFGIRFQNPHLAACYEKTACAKDGCPSYGKGPTRCWQEIGTFCKGSAGECFQQKFENCTVCPVFQESCLDSYCEIGEHFNNMMHILETKNFELQRTHEKLKTAQAQTIQQEKMASIGQLAAGVAHEINNPTGFISSNLGTLLEYQKDLFALIGKYRDFLSRFGGSGGSSSSDDPADRTALIRKMEEDVDLDFIIEDMPNLIDESREGTERIKKIVMDLKNFAHPGKQELVYADINNNLESTLNIAWNEIKYKATVTKDYGEIPEVQCYPQQLNQVFMNLLVNAAQAIEETGEIRLKTCAENGVVKILIGDTGKGIPQENLTHIFEPFFTTKEMGKGTGLGLHVAYTIVKKHNGNIFVDSSPGAGTTFTVEIPVEARGGEGDGSNPVAG